MKPVIFLDFDGVLNSLRSMNAAKTTAERVAAMRAGSLHRGVRRFAAVNCKKE